MDEKLSFLTAVLANGRSLDIAPLPPVETVPRDEDTEEFRAALKVAKTNDAEWLAAEDARRATGGKRMFRDKAAERALRDRVRGKLGMPPWKSNLDPKARAKELGIDPSYDLLGPDRNCVLDRGESAMEPGEQCSVPSDQERPLWVSSPKNIQLMAKHNDLDLQPLSRQKRAPNI